MKMSRNLPRHRLSKVLPNDVAAEGQRQSGLAKPPLTEVLNEVQSVVGERELPLMNEEADVDIPANDRVLDPIERSDDWVEVRLEETQREVRARKLPRNRDSLAPNVCSRHGRSRNQPRSVPVAHRSAVRQQRIPVGEVCVGMNRDRGYF